jgi:hypothetical protein
MIFIQKKPLFLVENSERNVVRQNNFVVMADNMCFASNNMLFVTIIFSLLQMKCFLPK